MAAVELRGFITRAAFNVARPLECHVPPPSPWTCLDASMSTARRRTGPTMARRCTSQLSGNPSEVIIQVRPKVGEKCILRNLGYSELEAWVESIGYKKSQALMLWRSLYGNGKWAATVDEMQGLSKEFRAALHDRVELDVLKVEKLHTAADSTCKIVFSVDGGTVETVVIPCASGRGRTTVCVSSQVGCAMNCQFCFTGRMGLKRNLSTAEIVEQLVVACRLYSKDLGTITNVVFMGMGEPLHNVDNVIRAANIMINDHGFHLSHHKVTVSTSGLVPQIQQYCGQTICSLAVSLNATTDEVRNWIMPINRKYSLGDLLNALRGELSSRPQRLVFFEYVMLAGVNDSIEDAYRLVKLVEGIPCLCAYIRQSRGDDQMAACGQLGTVGEQQPPRLSVPERFQAAVSF